MKKARFQTFDSGGDGSKGEARVASLRALFAKQGLAGFVVPRADEHQGEYVPESEARLRWLTGFSGSAGAAIVLKREAALFADGRYTSQARAETDPKVFTIVASHVTSPESWIEEKLKKGDRLGYDPRLHTADAVARLEKAARQAGATAAPVAANPVDAIWSDRPRRPAQPVVGHPLDFAGEATAEKLKRLRDILGKERLKAQFLSDPHDVAWLFNLRGGDIPHTPIALAYALVPAEGAPTLFVDAARLDPEARVALGSGVTLAPASSMEKALGALARRSGRIGCDAATCGAAWVSAIREKGGEPVVAPSPVAKLKAVKNAAELDGHRAAQRRDGVAMTRFLAWFDREAPKGNLTEIDAAVALEGFRAETNLLADISFPTISGAGPNAALPHYRVTTASNRKIGEGIFLIDSGGQYRDGTTDITRTLAVGAPTSKMKDRYTRVLKGHIAIATAVFPKGTTGAQLDSFARRALWDAGHDFDHGTGHGIGAFLSVHEGPQSISKRGAAVLEAGMIVSNEPGFYEEGGFGIRIENLVLVEPRRIRGGAREMLGFETLTLAPIDTTLIELSLMTADEIAWLDAYHARVRKALAPALAGKELAFLKRATRKIG